MTKAIGNLRVYFVSIVKMFNFLLKGKVMFLFSVYFKISPQGHSFFVAENSEVKLTGNRARAELKLITWA